MNQITARERWVWGAMALTLMVIDFWAYYASTGWLKRWMANYGHDVLLPAFLYFFTRTIWPRGLNRALFVVVFVLGGTTAFEFAQLGRLYAGTFDPLDFLAYLAGITLALSVDLILFRRSGQRG